jgi:hypothetical protein
MNAKRVIEIINILELESNIINWKFKDLDFWPLLRLEIYMSLSFDLMHMTHNNDKFSRIKSLIEGNIKFPLKYFNDYKNNSNFEKNDILFLSDGISFTKINGKLYEKFIDPLKTEIDKRCLSSLRLDPYHNYHIPRFSSSKFIQPFIDPIIIKEYLTFREESDFDKTNKSTILKIFKNLNLEKFNPVLEQAFLKAKLIYKISIYFEKKLKKVQPKIVFIVYYYGLYGMSMTLACRRLSIPTVDLQHGVQGDLHAAYGNWLNVPKDGFNLLPNYFWCWSKTESNAINQWSHSVGNHEAITGGNMLLEIWKSKEYDFINDYEKIFNQLNFKGYKILVTLSPGISSSNVLSNLFQVIAETQNQYNWLIRLHPNMLSQKKNVIHDLKSYGIYNYEINQISRLPLYTILNNTDLHITHSSSTVIEASMFGIQSVIINEYGKELYAKQIDEGYAVLRIKPHEIKSEILNISKFNKKEVNDESLSKLALDKIFEKISF